MSKITFETIEKNIVNGWYSGAELAKPSSTTLGDDYVFDENMSVRVNRQMVQKHNSMIIEAKLEYRSKMEDREKDFENHAVIAISDELGVSTEVAKSIFEYSYGCEHSAGYMSVIDHLRELIGLITKVIESERARG